MKLQKGRRKTANGNTMAKGNEVILRTLSQPLLTLTGCAGRPPPPCEGVPRSLADPRCSGLGLSPSLAVLDLPPPLLSLESNLHIAPKKRGIGRKKKNLAAGVTAHCEAGQKVWNEGQETGRGQAGVAFPQHPRLARNPGPCAPISHPRKGIK
jgi:hypothetical protein